MGHGSNINDLDKRSIDVGQGSKVSALSTCAHEKSMDLSQASKINDFKKDAKTKSMDLSQDSKMIYVHVF